MTLAQAAIKEQACSFVLCQYLGISECLTLFGHCLRFEIILLACRVNNKKVGQNKKMYYI